MADKDLTFRLFGRDVSASKALQGVGAQAQQTARQVEASSKAASASTIGLGVALGNLMTATAQQAKSMISLGVSTANSMQQAGIGFTTLLGSAQEAGDYLAQLKSFAASTPFEFAGLVDASRLLLGVGVQADMVIPILTDLGDAAGALAIDQESFGRIMLAVSQSISAGTIKLGDMNQLMTNGIPAWKLMSEAMGKPVPVLQDMISKGELLSADVLPKMFAEMHKDYGGAMAQQAQTLGGLWSTLQDTLSQGMADALQPLIPLLSAGLAGATKLAEEAAANLGDSLRRNESTIRAWGESFASGIRWVMDHGSALLDFAEAAAVAIGAYKAMTLAQTLLNVAMSANPVGLIVVGLAALAGAFVLAWKHSETFRKVVAGMFVVLAEQARFAVKVASIAIVTLLQVGASAASHIPGIGAGIADSLRSAAASVAGTAQSMDASIQAIRNKVVSIAVVTQYIEVQGIASGKVARLQREAGSANAREGRSASAADIKAVQGKSSAPKMPSAIKLPSMGGGGAGAGGGGSSAKSAAREAVAGDLADLAAALKESRKKAGEAFAKLAGDVSKAGSAAARRIVDSYAKVVLPLAQKYEAIAKSLKAAQDKLAKLRDDAKQYAADAKRSVVEGSKLGEQESVGGIVNSLRESISYAQQFAANLAKIKALGADATTIQQLVAAGPKQGLKLGEQLAATGKSGVAQVAGLQAQLNAAANSLGAGASNSMYSAGIAAAQGLVKGLASQQSALAKQMATLANAMVTAIKRALKIKSPSQVFERVGVYSGAGLVKGLEGQYGAVQSAAGRMMGAIGANGARTAALAAAPSTRGGDTIQVYGALIDSSDLHRLTQQARRRQAYVGAA